MPPRRHGCSSAIAVARVLPSGRLRSRGAGLGPVDGCLPRGSVSPGAARAGMRGALCEGLALFGVVR